jgi:hypothetical protein
MNLIWARAKLAAYARAREHKTFRKLPSQIILNILTYTSKKIPASMGLPQLTGTLTSALDPLVTYRFKCFQLSIYKFTL